MTLRSVVWSELTPCKSSTFLVFSITGAFSRQAPQAGGADKPYALEAGERAINEHLQRRGK